MPLKPLEKSYRWHSKISAHNRIVGLSESGPSHNMPQKCNLQITLTQLEEVGPKRNMQIRHETCYGAIAVFAHNEEGHILHCLRSIQDTGLQVYVLINGCTDATERVVAAYASNVAGVELISIATADKANAWNVFVHRVAPLAEAYYFLDGDVIIAPGALDELAKTLKGHSHAHAAAAVPLTGRSRRLMTKMVLTDRLVMGNLYALSGAFVHLLRRFNLQMPIGYIGDDGWVTSIAKWNGDPQNAWDETRVEPCLNAGYLYRSFSPFVAADWKKYWRRRVRYSLRHFQHLLLCTVLKEGGLSAMPTNVRDLYLRYSDVASLRPRKEDFFFDWLALRHISKLQHTPNTG